MKKRLTLILFALLLLDGLLPGVAVGNGQQEAVIPFDTPDPTALESPDGSGVYVFTTAPGITITRSTNLLDWQRCGRVFQENTPAWAVTMVPGARNIWAPDIVAMNEKYYLYYSVSTFGSQRSVIGVATNETLNPDNPGYKWVDQGLVLESHPDHTDYNAIDSALFVDVDGKAYLFWGSYWTGLKAVEVDATTGKPFRYLDGDWKIPAEYVAVACRESQQDTSIEAPYVVKHDNYYYLFTSRGSCCDGERSTYHIAVGRATRPLGPYLDRDGKRMDEGGGTVILSSTEKWKGTGHNGFFRTRNTDGTQCDWLILAAYNIDRVRSGRLTQVRPLHWDAAGWPAPGEVLSCPMQEYDINKTKHN
ncbi:MAG: arabinan endo-1,5-alpha-L-arabinosidase [Planctomycetaceae bacterium]|nr:arabinan endo-1,5-alpha-L-arabinosidase [Planctomycetaceae bacterium]